MLSRPASLAALFVLLAFRTSLLAADVYTIAVVALVIVSISIVLVARTATLGLWSSGFWYLVILACFHLGLAVPLSLGYPVDGKYASYALTWFGSSSYRVEATYLSTLAVAAFSCGYVWLHGKRERPDEEATRPDGAEARLGVALTVLGVGGLAGVILSNKTGALFQFTRGAYIEGAANGGVGALAGFLIAFGGLFLAVAPPSPWRRFGLAVLGVFAVWALLVGARSLVLYPAIAMLIAAARVAPMPRPRVALAALVGGLVVVSVVASYRTDGIAGTDLRAADVNPLSGLNDMGGSIRPLTENLKYAHVLNEPPSHGSTYAGPTLRALERAAGLPRPEGFTDLRLAGNEFRGRVGGFQVGYSAVAEAYRNFRTPGVLGVFLLFGAALGSLDSRRLGRQSAAVMSAVVFFALTYHVRQPSTQIVPLLVVGAVMVWICTTLNHQGRRKQARAQAKEAHTAAALRRLPA